MGRVIAHWDDIAYVTGACAVVVGAFLVAVPLGFVALGVACIALAFFGGS